MISPQELKKISFSKAFTGYAAGEVDEYISYLISKYNEAFAENNELSQKLMIANEQLSAAKSDENAISATIVNAQKMADAIVTDAKQKANEIMSDATEKSEAVTSAVSESCDRILAAYMAKATAERDRLEKIEKAVSAFKNELYDAYKQHISLIDTIMPDDNSTPYLSDAELEEKAVEFAKEELENKDNSDIDIPDLSHQSQEDSSNHNA